MSGEGHLQKGEVKKKRASFEKEYMTIKWGRIMLKDTFKAKKDGEEIREKEIK